MGFAEIPRAGFGLVPPSGVGAVGKWPADATAESLAAAGHLSTAVVIVNLRYPTNFSPMNGAWIERLSRRGEQMTKALMAEHPLDL